MKNVILTSDELKRTLGDDDDFITVTLENREYVIEGMKRVPNYTDAPISHKTLLIRDGGEGELRR